MHRVTGTWESGGARVPGAYRVVLPVRVQDTTGDVIHHQGIYASGTLSTAAEPAYSLDVNVPATNDPDLSPQGWQVEIQIRFTDGGGSETYLIPAPDGGTTDLSDVVLPQTIPAPEPVLIRGVAGGIAGLDADGDVIDADGNKVPVFLDFSTLPEPVIAGHRGAGVNVAPENTIEALRVGYAMGLREMNIDAYLLADGSLGCVHDATIDRVTSATGNTVDETASSWINKTIDSSAWFGGNWPDCKPMLLAQAVAEFGGRACFDIESFSLGAATALGQFIVARGLQKTMLVTSRALTDLQAVRAIDSTIQLEYIDDYGAIAPATLTANGIRYITLKCGEIPDGTTTGCLPARALDYVAAGIKVRLHSPFRACEISPYLSAGVTVAGIESDDPLYCAHGFGSTVLPNVYSYRRTSDPFKSKTWYSGMVASGGGLPARGAFISTRWGMNGGQSGWTLQGWGCPIASLSAGGAGTVTMPFTLTWDGLPTDMTRWDSIVIGSLTDRGWGNNLHPNDTGYNCLIRGNGAMEISRQDGTTVTQCPGNIPSGSGLGSMVAGDTLTGTLQLTSTNVIFSATHGATTKTITWADTTYRGPYFHAGQASNVAANPAHAASWTFGPITA